MTAPASLQLPYQPPFKGTAQPLGSIYSPVPHGSIRVLHVLDFGEKGLLRCRLDTQSFEENPYTAISYTWNHTASIWYGSPTETGKPIRVNGTVVSVRDKVADILCLMHYHGKRAVWIDGVCINQDDSHDKEVQVANMGKVYRHAREVVTILNSPTNETDYLFDRHHWGTENLNSQRDLLHRTLLTVLANDYWRRTWILQEIVLAQDITLHCGNRSVSFDELATLYEKLDANRSQTVGEFSRGAGRLVKTLLKGDPAVDSKTHGQPDGGPMGSEEAAIFSSSGRASFQKMPFLDLLEKSRRFNRCFDPKDILYARRGLASDGATLIPEVKYSKDVSAEDVYKHFAQRCASAQSQTPLRVITYASWMSEGDLPSWVPDWRAPTGAWQARFKPPDNKGRKESEQQRNPDADNSLFKLQWSSPVPTVSADGNELTVPGRILVKLTPELASHFTRKHKAITKFAIGQLRQSSSYNFKSIFPDPPKPVAGDVICALMGCPAFVFLQPVERGRYKLVGKYEKFQGVAAKHCLGDTVVYEENVKDSVKWWEWRDVEAVNKLREEVFTIV